jgi:UDP-N-acetylglucosamine enolpyruvyl transferase
MEKLVIEGGVPLSGTIVPAGNKNAALPLLAASLLTDERVVIANVPRIRDTEAMLALLADLGVKVEWIEDNTVSLQADAIADTDVDPDLAERIRASFLVAGPLLARFGSRRAATSSAAGASTRTSTRSARSAPRWSTATTSASPPPTGAFAPRTSSWTSRPSWARRTR